MNSPRKHEMAERRQRQLAREPGFTPVSNARVDGAIATAFMMIQTTKPHLTAAEAQREAVNEVRKNLPRAKPSRLYRHRPSKSDSALYRKAA